MKTAIKTMGWISLACFVLAVAGFGAMRVLAHCDTLDGPVVKEARVALEKGEAAPLLKWVKKEQEEEIRAAFEKTRKVRAKEPEAKELADMYFFETLVRLHRAGEGAPYTGLKPAGAVSPAVAAADESLEKGSVDALADRVSNAVRASIRQRFDAALEKKTHAGESVEAGREFVESYIEYVHFVEAIHEIVSEDAAHGHEGHATTEDAAPSHEAGR